MDIEPKAFNLKDDKKFIADDSDDEEEGVYAKMEAVSKKITPIPKPQPKV